MNTIEHDVTPIAQRTSECLQTAATQMLSFFDPGVCVDDVVAEVPVHVENGEKVGTSPGHVAAYLAERYDTTVHVFDVELFDRSWAGLDAAEVAGLLRERQPHIPARSWLSAYAHILIAGWETYARAGGTFAFPRLSAQLLVDLLADGPYVVMLSSTYLNDSAKKRYNADTDRFDPAPLEGRSVTHSVTCVGYRDERFVILDPEPPAGEPQRREIERDHLIASIMAAQTESDNLLLTVRPRGEATNRR